MIRALQGIRGVGRVELIGAVQREIRVGLDPIRLTALRCTATAIGLLIVIVLFRPSLLRVRRSDLPGEAAS